MAETTGGTITGSEPALTVASGGDREAALRDAVAAFQSGDLGRTAATCRLLTRADREDARAWHLLGCVYGRQRRPARAARCFARAVDLAPDNAGYLVNLASAHLDLGRFTDAIATLTQALDQLAAGGEGVHPRVLPDAVAKLTQAHARRADQLMQSGDPNAAVSHYEQALRRGGRNPDILSKLGSAHVLRGAYGDALAPFREVVRLRPDSVDDVENYALVLFRLGRTREVMQILQDLIRRLPASPQLASVHCNLGVFYGTLGHDDRALEHFQKAMAISPDAPEPRQMACRALLTLGRADEAETHLETLAVTDPGSAACLAIEGRLLAFRGDLPGAYTKLRAAVATPGAQSDSWAYYAAICADLGRSEEGISALTEAVARQFDPYDRAKLQYQLGRLHDDLGNADLAFAAYAAANRYRASTTRFDATELQARTTEMIELFSPERFAALPRSRQTTPLPVFIVGMPRSGTSLVEQILDSHPLAAGAGELPHIGRLSRSLPTTLGSQATYPQCLIDAGADALDTIAAGHLDTLRSLTAPAARISDKMPENFHHLGLISLLYPQATIIHCVRDPVDTCLSCFFQDFRASLSFCFDLERLAAYYREYRRLMRHWSAGLGLRIVDVGYEDLVADPEPVIRRLIDAVGLPWDERCLSFHENKRVVLTASMQQVRRPVYATSVGRWKRYEAHLGPLLDGLAEFL